MKAFLARGPVFGLLLCLPALLMMAFVLVYPLLRSISLSFQRMNLVYPAANSPFVGLENYIRLFTLEPYFAQVLGTTALFVIVTVLCGFTLGFILALILQRVTRSTRRSANLIPIALCRAIRRPDLAVDVDVQPVIWHCQLYLEGIPAHR